MSAGGKDAGRVVGLFETPLIVSELPDAAALNAELKRLILEKRAADPGIRVSNVGGWHSEPDLERWSGEAGRRIIAHMIDLCWAHTVDTKAGPDGVPTFHWQTEAWANVSGPGAINHFHYHTGAYWSAVYYVDDGYGDGDGAGLGGELVLRDPRLPGIKMHAPTVRFRRANGKPHQGERNVRPKAGHMLMFPSWLEHGVAPYAGDGLRISIAINASVRPGVVSG